MNFLKTSILTGISTIVKLGSALVINKIVAVYIGPTGVALIGQFQNFLGIITTIGNGAINSGVTKYVAEFNGRDEKKRNDVISAAFIITLSISFIIGSIIFFGSSRFSQWIFKTEEYSSLLKVLGVTLVFIGFNTIILSIINGLKKIKLFIVINISSSLLSLLITSLLTMKFKIWGALLAMIIVQSLILTISLPIAIRKLNINFSFNLSLEGKNYRKLFAFSLMAIVTVISGSMIQILIRNYLIKYFSLEQAGYWQSVWMISSMYLMVLTTAFSTYYLPRLSELTRLDDIRKEILSGYKIIIPFVLATASIIFLLKDVIIQVLFTNEFSPMRNLFLFQLVGDFLKMCSWSLAYLMIAKAMTKAFILSEILFSISFYLLTVFFTSRMGLEGVTMAYALSYLIYFLIMIIMFRKIFFKKYSN